MNPRPSRLGSFTRLIISCLAFTSRSHIIIPGVFQTEALFDDAVSAISDETAPPFLPERTCPRFFMVTSERGGIGHRLAALTLAIPLAVSLRAGIIIDDSLLDQPRYAPGRPGLTDTYPYLSRLFNLGAFLTTTTAGVQYDEVGNLVGAQTPAGWVDGFVTRSVPHGIATISVACNRIAILATGHEACKRPGSTREDYCLVTGMAGAFQAARPTLSARFAAGPYAAQPLIAFRATVAEAAPTLAVVWHVRNDDIKPRARDTAYWTNVVASVRAALDGTPSHHYVVSQCPIDPADPDFGLLHSFPGWSWTGLHHLKEDEAIYHMAAADILIHGGSSFSIIAGLVADTNQVALYQPPLYAHEPIHNETLWLDGSIPIPPHGMLPGYSMLQLRERAMHRLHNKPQQWRVPLPAPVSGLE